MGLPALTSIEQLIPAECLQHHSAPATMADLPTELIYDIFRVAADTSVEFCLTLSLVSSWARRLVMKRLCSTAVIKSNETCVKFSQFITKSKPKSKDAITYHHESRPDMVRSVWFQTGSYHIVDVLFVCRYITHIAVSKEGFDWLRRYSGGWDQSGMKKVSRSADQEHRNLQMCLLLKKSQLNNWTSASHIQNPPPIYRQIVHLRLSDCGSYAPHKLNLSLFPRLKKFAVPFYDSSIQSLDDLRDTVESHPSLEVLVVALVVDWISPADVEMALRWIRGMTERRDDDSDSSLASPDSPTLQVYCVETQSSMLQEEWEADARFGNTLWNRAEEFTRLALPPTQSSSYLSSK